MFFKNTNLKFYCLNYTMKCLKGHAAFLQFLSNIHAKFIKFYISNPWISQIFSLVPLSLRYRSLTVFQDGVSV